MSKERQHGNREAKKGKKPLAPSAQAGANGPAGSPPVLPEQPAAHRPNGHEGAKRRR